MTNALEQACARTIQVGRQTVSDLNYVLRDVQSEATRDEIEQLLLLFIQRAANRMTVAHAALWQALHPEHVGDAPLLPISWLVDAPSSAQLGVVRTSITDCRSTDGITAGLIDALISILRVLAVRDLTSVAVREALLDLAGDGDLQLLLRSAQICAAGVCAQTAIAEAA